MGRRSGPLAQAAAIEGNSEACAAKMAAMQADLKIPTLPVLGEGRDRYRLCCQRAEQILNSPRVKPQLTSELQLDELTTLQMIMAA